MREKKRAGRNRINLQEATLRKMHLDQGLSLVDMAMKFGVSKSLIYNRMREYGIPLRKQPSSQRGRKPLILAEGEIRYYYEDEEMTLKQTATALGVSVGTLFKQMVRYGIDRKPAGHKGKDTSSVAGKDNRFTKDNLQRMYWEDGMTMTAIGRYYGVTRERIRQVFGMFGIKLRKLITEDKKDLIEEMLREGHSIVDIRRHLKMSREKVSKVALEVDLHPKKRVMEADDPELLRKLYEQEHKTVSEIADNLGVSSSFITRLLKKHCIKVHRRSVHPDLLDKDWLREQVGAYSITQLCKRIGCSRSLIYHWARVHGITILDNRSRTIN